MNKLAEKVVAAMNESELERLIDDHYASEAQTLTRGAEQNLLKLAELRGRQNDEQKARWSEIKEAFVRVQRMGGKDEDPVARVTGSRSPCSTTTSKGIRETLGRARRSDARNRPKNGDGSARAAAGARNARAPQARGHAARGFATPISLAWRMTSSRCCVRYSGRSLTGGAGRRNNGHDLRLAEIATAIGNMQRVIERGMARPERFDVALETQTRTNFFPPRIEPGCFCSLGGLFVATYEKPPALGAPIELALAFPTGPTCTVFGAVSYTQDELSEDSPAGFGVRFSEVSPEARALIEEYASVREPLLRDD